MDEILKAPPLRANVGTVFGPKMRWFHFPGGLSDQGPIIFFNFRNAGKTVGDTFLRLRTFTKNGRLHVLKFKNKNPSKTPRSYENSFL